MDDAAATIPPAPWRPDSSQEVPSGEVPEQAAMRLNTVPNNEVEMTTRPNTAREATPTPTPAPPGTARPSTARTPRTRKPALDMSSPRGYTQQSLANRNRSPAYGFGASTRAVANKLFISQGHTLSIMYGKDSPGPAGYNLPPSVGGKQPDGRKPDPPVWDIRGGGRYDLGGKPFKIPDAGEYDPIPVVTGGRPATTRLKAEPAYSFGSTTREVVNKLFISQQHTLTIQYGSQSPGPANYATTDLIGGKQPDASKPDAPTYKIGSAARVSDEPGLDTPGPIYGHCAAVGPQVDGRFPSAMLASFGASTRAQRAKLFMGSEMQECASATEAQYTLRPAIGDQVHSGIHGRNATSPRVSFSRNSRWKQYEMEARKNSVPGPGAYG